MSEDLTKRHRQLSEKLNDELHEYAEIMLKNEPNMPYETIVAAFMLTKIAEVHLMLEALEKRL